jgi:hypothetical protein
VAKLNQRVADARTKGYVFEKDLETRAAGLQSQWTPLEPAIQTQINDQAMRLDMEVRSIQSLMMQLAARSTNPGQAAPYLSQAKSAIDTMKSKVNSAENTIRGMYDSFSNQLSEFSDHLQKIEQSLDWLAAASFQLRAIEGLVMAVEASWAADGKPDNNDPRGMLYLTDQRLIFEQNQEIATKKFLFITTESEKIQKELFEIPLELIDNVIPVKMGLFKNEDHLDMQIKSGGPFHTCHLHLFNQACEDWDRLITRVKEGDLDKNRVTPVSQEEMDKVKKAPTQCPACGGTIDQPVLRGQDTIKCGYCGFVIRL